MSTPFYLERYLSGEFTRVWKELVDLGPTVSQDPMRSDALAVAAQIVETSCSNLTTLKAKLLSLGYRFANPAGALVEAKDKDLAELSGLQAGLGGLPLIAQAWYSRIAAVDFRQAREQIFVDRERSASRSPIDGLGYNCGLVFLRLSDSLRLREELVSSARIAVSPLGTASTFLPTGAFASNSEPKGFRLPNSSADAPIYNAGAGEVLFVEDLRNAFRFGGFPYWKHLLRGRSTASPLGYVPDFRRILPELLDGLNPM